LSTLEKVLVDPANDGGKILVEIYLNYDCDVDSGDRENIWERIIGALSKVNTTHYKMELSSSNAASLTPPSNLSIGNAPALSTTSLTNFSKEQIKELYSASGDFNELKRQGLVVLVQGVLEPLVNWCNEKMDERVSKSIGGLNEIAGEDGDVSPGVDGEADGEASDDPMAFESMKQRKGVLLEGIKRFNFKPKKV
jgi:brefeldin A-inhibited guanine nucleotide-exchange protein